jgi:hypothetical protein
MAFAIVVGSICHTPLALCALLSSGLPLFRHLSCMLSLGIDPRVSPPLFFALEKCHGGGRISTPQRHADLGDPSERGFVVGEGAMLKIVHYQHDIDAMLEAA